MKQNIDKLEIKLQNFIQSISIHDSAHDFLHVKRVVDNAKYFARSENANLDIVIPSAWLHDCVNLAKSSANSGSAAALSAREAIRFLHKIKYPNEYIPDIENAIVCHSFSAGLKPKTIEGKIIQDADRIDAIGAIGIARCFIVGGSLSIPLYNEMDPFRTKTTPDDKMYIVDHFYQKLLKLPERMHTDSAKVEAQKRVKFMKDYLKELKNEIAFW